jgi:hypothetical protein
MTAKDAQKRECDARCGTEMRQGEAVKWGIILKSTLDFLLIELIIKCKLNETQGQDWGVTLTKKLKLILIGKFKSVKFRNVKFD